MKNNFMEFITKKQNQYGEQFDTSDLAPQFTSYFENGARIEVQFEDGMVKRGRVGVSTGWKPCYLLMLTKRAIGSCYTLNEKDKILRVVSA